MATPKANRMRSLPGSTTKQKLRTTPSSTSKAAKSIVAKTSPIKARARETTFTSQTPKKSDSDPFKKIPHGLTYKHETRHHHHSKSDPTTNSTARRNSMSPKGNARVVSPVRHPLTCIKDSINSKKFDKLMVGAKQDLTKVLENATDNGEKNDGKENKDTTASKSGINETDENNKDYEDAASTHDQVHINDSVIVNDMLGNSSILKLVLEQQNLQDDTDEISSSPIKPQHSHNRKRHSDIRAEHSFNKKQHLADNEEADESFKTPKKSDKASKLATPHREHHSRILDESVVIDLQHPDNTIDKLHLQQSPLANVSQGSIILNDEVIDGETEVIRDLKKVNKVGIHDLSTAGATDDHDENEKRPEGEVLSPVKLSSNVSPLDVFNSIFEIEESDEEYEEMSDLAIHEADTSAIPLFSASQVDSIKAKYTESMNSLKSEISEKQQEISSLSTQLTGSQNTIHLLTEELNDLTSENKNLVKYKEALTLEIEQSKAGITSLSSKLQNVEFQKKSLAGKLTKLKNAFKQLMSTARSYESDLSTKQIKIDELIEDVKILNNSKASLKSDNVELEANLALKNKELEKLSNEKSEIENKLNEMVQLKENYESELENVSGKLSELKSSLVDENDVKEKLKVEIKTLTEQLEDLQNKLNNSDDQAKEWKDKHDSAAASKGKLELELGDLNKELDRMSSELDDLKDNVANEQGGLLKIGEEKKVLIEEKQQLKKEVEELKIRLNEATKSQEESESKLKISNFKRESLVEKLASEVTNLKTEITELKDSYASKLKESSEISDEKEIQLSAQLTEITSLKQQVISLENNLKQANVKIEENETTLEAQLEKLAQDLYLQYAAKHEQKVSILKKGYEMKWSSKMKKMIKENEELKKDLETTKKKLEIEANEKKQLVKLWEEYVSLENNEKSPRKAVQKS